MSGATLFHCLFFSSTSLSKFEVILIVCSWITYLQEPNPEDPLNKEAAEVLQTNRRLFETNVQKSMRGGYIGSV